LRAYYADEASATASGHRDLALVLDGPKGVADASGEDLIKTYPPLG
jgi:hypothetical protein